MAGYGWTEEEEQDLRRHFAAGLSHAEIGRKMGRSKDAVTTKLGRMGLKRANPVRGVMEMRVKQRAGKVTLARLQSLASDDAGSS